MNFFHCIHQTSIFDHLASGYLAIICYFGNGRDTVVSIQFNSILIQTLTNGWCSGLHIKQSNLVCSWARHFTLAVPLTTQMYNWYLVSLPCNTPASHLGLQGELRRNTPSHTTLPTPA